MNQPGENDKIILDPILACFTQMWTPFFCLFLFQVLALLVVRHCSKLSSYAV